MENGLGDGHENLGIVTEVGSAVDRVKVGQLVCLPFNIGCGFCRNCERGLTGFCLTCNSASAGAAYGFADMGPYDSLGQAEQGKLALDFRSFWFKGQYIRTGQREALQPAADEPDP